ncbi:hypothetical protein [Streptomyces sp. NPDC001502]|uniref:hypothetical protein n=1 Tax=Streptomyces sp. NPDC001502 TaxID=3364578 RepID=UPI003674C65E
MRLLPTAPFGPVRVKADPYLVRTGTYVKVDRVDEEQFTKALDGILGSTDPEFGKLISAVLRNRLDGLLGTVTAGTHRRDYSLVTVDGENIIRLDSMLWLYNFDGAGLTADVRNAFAYGAALSSVRIDEIDHGLLRLMVSHMVNEIPGLTPEERKEKAKELHARLVRDKDGRVEKRRRLAALTRAVNDRLHSPVGISVGRDGFLHLASPDTGLIWRTAPGYEVTTVAGGGTDYRDGIPALEAKLERPFAVAPDRTTRGFVIADFGGARGEPGHGGRVLRVSADGIIRTIADGTRLPGADRDHPIKPTHVAVDRGGTVHVVALRVGTDPAELRILRIPPSGPVSVIGQGDLETRCSPTLRRSVFGVAAHEPGQALFSFSACGTVDRLPDGGTRLTTVAGGGDLTGDLVPALEARLRYPCALDIDDDGSLYIADGLYGPRPEDFRVRKVTADGRITTVVRGRDAYGIAVDGPRKILYTLEFRDDCTAYCLKAYVLPG